MRYRVVTCLLATGHVCHPDGRLYLTTDGPRDDPEFHTLADAQQHCRETVALRADLECWVMDSAGVALFRVPPTAGNDPS